MLTVVKVALLALLLAASAQAAPCGDQVALDTAVNALLVHANNPADKSDASYLDRCATDLLAPKQKDALARFNIACAAILDADPAHVTCATAAIQVDKQRVGRVQLFDSVRGWEHDPWKGSLLPSGENRVLAAYQKLGDDRASAVVRDTWTAAATEAAAKESSLTGWQKKQAMATWRAWRIQAALTLGALGNDAVVELLEKESRSADRAVARACRDALRLIRAFKKATQ